MQKIFGSSGLLITRMIALVLCLLPGPVLAVTIEEVTTKSGAKVYLVEDQTIPVIAVAISFRGGASQDLPGKEGTLRLTAALLDEGAGNLDSAAYQSRLEETGVELGFSASRDELTVIMRTVQSERDNAFELLRLALGEPRFDADAIERMRDALKRGIKQSRKNPDDVASRTLRESVFGHHVYSRSVRGDETTIGEITREDIVSIHRKVVARDRLSIGVVGAINKNELSKMLDEVLDSLPAKSALEIVEDVSPSLGHSKALNMPVPQASITMVYPGLKRSHPDFFATHLMNHILGGGTFSSRIHREVREKRGLVYSISSWLATYDHAAYLAISTSTRRENLEETLATIKAEVSKMAENGVTAEELEAAKKYVIGVYAINNLASSTGIARVLVALQTENLGIDYLDTRKAEISSVRLEDVNRLARQLLSVDPAVVIVGPEVE